MREYFWTHVVPSNDKETIGGVCYDIRDAVSNIQGVQDGLGTF